MSDRALYLARLHRAAYLETTYHVLEDSLTNSPLNDGEYLLREVAFTLSAMPSTDRLFDDRSFALITAANPRSEMFDELQNRERNSRLHLELERRGISNGSSYGTDKAKTWREDGFVLWDVVPALALELGRMFEQNAIVYGKDGRVALGWCDVLNLDEALEWFFPRCVR